MPFYFSNLILQFASLKKAALQIEERLFFIYFFVFSDVK